MEHIKSKDVEVGDILAVKCKENFPCDLIILAASSLKGKCYVMTANLDGESNLKPKLALRETRKYMNVSFLKNLSGQIECQNPSPDLFSFSGKATIVKDYGIEKCSIGIDNLAMRGTQLRNTDYILGLAVYTGPDTKMSQNSKINSNKFSSVERILNFCFILYLVLLLSEVALCLTLGAVYGLEADIEAGGQRPRHWYLASRGQNAESLMSDGVSYLILFSYIVPASLYVTLEIQRVVNSMFIIWDRDLVTGGSDPPMVNCSDINEELGQINILFTDKTGTLTENVMVFKAASIAGTLYSVEDLRKRKRFKCSYADMAGRTHYDEVDTSEEPKITERQEKKIHQFLMALCLCHSGQVTPKEDIIRDGDLFYGCSNESFVSDEDDVDGLGHSLTKFEYNAPSPDEKAILEGCSELGMKFAGEDEVKSNCRVLDTRSASSSVKSYRRLHTLEFDSVRKRMSVIVRHPGGKTYLITKGAESSLMPRCVAGPSQETEEHIDQCAVLGVLADSSIFSSFI